MYNLAPGNILQNMYIKARIREMPDSYETFCEIGSGNGVISNIFLEHGYRGFSYEINPESCKINNHLNNGYIQNSNYEIKNMDFLADKIDNKVDVIITCMVIEHLPDEKVSQFFTHCRSILNKNGIIVTLVPSNKKYWGIEDETAGHYKRYEFNDFNVIASQHNLKLKHIAGLTYPLSNFLFRISNHLVRKSEKWKKDLSIDERTANSASGVRSIKFKTEFPDYFKYFLNEITMYPFYLLQVFFKRNKNCMVIYSELSNQ